MNHETNSRSVTKQLDALKVIFKRRATSKNQHQVSEASHAAEERDKSIIPANHISTITK